MLFKRKILFVINPKSGNGSNKPVFSDIEKVLKNDFHQIEVAYSNYKGHATELATLAIKNNFDVVVAVGGDGTVNEVALALNGTGKSLAIIPSGSGNGLARHHKIPFNIQKALQVIANNNVIDHDSIKINEFTSFNVSGIGFDALVAHLLEKTANEALSLMSN
ncbi:MAG: NAD(+)/NADH kinase [Bacteroidetes bacterium]|nr:NAD(+)/NADH kinase [Bacteroidota bacterium]